jgi:hypothetical protein
MKRARKVRPAQDPARVIFDFGGKPPTFFFEMEGRIQ